MFKRDAMGSARAKIFAGAVLMAIGLSVAGSAMSTNLFGGGATLPAGAYVGFDFNKSSPANKLSSNTGANHLRAGVDQVPATVNSGSLFGAWAAASGNKVSYCQTGSGNAKKIFNHTDGASLTFSATGWCDGTTQNGSFGFAADTSVTVDPHFAASDAPISQIEYSRFFSPGDKAAKYTQPVEFPVVVGSIAIIVNNANATSVNLTTAQLCELLRSEPGNNYVNTTWASLGLPDAPASGSYDGKTVRIVYRQDSSGTTFALANHLANVCGGTLTAHFVTDQDFTKVESLYYPSMTSDPRFIPANGSAEVVRIANNTLGSIAFVEAGNVEDAKNRGISPNVTYAKYNGLHPIADLPNQVTLAVLPGDQGIRFADANTGVVTFGALAPVVQPGCINLVNPMSYATAPITGTSKRYQIIAVSYLIANSTGNGSDVSAVQGLIGSAYNTAIRPSVTSIGSGTGYAFVNAPIAAARVNGCIKS